MLVILRLIGYRTIFLFVQNIFRLLRVFYALGPCAYFYCDVALHAFRNTLRNEHSARNYNKCLEKVNLNSSGANPTNFFIAPRVRCDFSARQLNNRTNHFQKNVSSQTNSPVFQLESIFNFFFKSPHRLSRYRVVEKKLTKFRPRLTINSLIKSIPPTMVDPIKKLLSRPTKAGACNTQGSSF
jgi:hypothetical protein